MARRRHDSLGKDLLSLWLEQLGAVASPRRVQGEERQVDLVFSEAAAEPPGYRAKLGVLGRMARGLTALEVFRNPSTADELRSCVLKVVELHEELRRRARRGRDSLAAVPLPHLWALTPTLSDDLRGGFGARQRRGMPRGFLGLPGELGTTVVVLARLPRTPETLWLRLLARGEVQRAALEELGTLPSAHPLREETVLRVLRWRTEASQSPAPSEADEEFLMNSERLVAQWKKELLREGKAEGKAEGRAEGEAKGKAEALLLVLGARGLEPSAEQVSQVRSCREPAALERWLVRATTAPTLAEVFAPVARKRQTSSGAAARRSRR
jgi:hypothetical protein